MNFQQKITKFACARRGTAPLELVLGLPFILAVGAAVLTVGWVGLHKTDSLVQSRHAAFKKRSTPPDSVPLYIAAAADAGAISEESATEVRVYKWLGGSYQAKSKTAVLGGTWDYEQIPDFKDYPKAPHFATLARVAGADSGDVAIINGAAAILFALTGSALPNQDQIDDAEGGLDDAEEDRDEAQEDQDKKIREEIEKRQKEIDELVKQRGLLEDRLEEKLTEVGDAQAELDDLEEQADSYRNKTPSQPVPEALRNAIAAKKAERDRLQGEADVIQGQIDEINRRIERLEAEIRDLESI